MVISTHRSLIYYSMVTHDQPFFQPPLDILSCRQAFEREAAVHSLEMRPLPEATGEAGRAALRDIVGDGEYFHVYLPDGSQVCTY